MTHSRSRDQATAALLVAAACVVELATMGRAVVGLAVVLVASFALWVARAGWSPARDVVPVSVAAIVVQCAHLVEEYRTGFHLRFPPLFGADPWSARRFLAFNFVWLALFALGALGLRRGNRLAYLLVLFLALGGGVANGLAHLGLSVRAGGYFPGAYTGALSLAVGGV